MRVLNYDYEIPPSKVRDDINIITLKKDLPIVRLAPSNFVASPRSVILKILISQIFWRIFCSTLVDLL